MTTLHLKLNNDMKENVIQPSLQQSFLKQMLLKTNIWWRNLEQIFLMHAESVILGGSIRKTLEGLW